MSNNDDQREPAVLEKRAWHLVEKTSTELQTLGFSKLVQQSQMRTPQIEGVEEFQDFPEGQLATSVVVSRLGRRRVSVEVTVTGDGWERWADVPCRYFEKSADGTVFVPGPTGSTKAWSWIAAGVLALALCDIVASVLYKLVAGRKAPW